MRHQTVAMLLALALLLGCGAEEAAGRDGQAAAGGVSGMAAGAAGSAGVTAAAGSGFGNPAAGGSTPANPPTGNGSTGDGGTGLGCEDELAITVRDFTEAHPDFESFSGGALTGIVKARLGSDGKPEYAHPAGTVNSTGPAEFAQWYNDTPSVNMRIPVGISFDEPTPGTFVYDNSAFFPIDGMGFGNGPVGFMIPGIPIPGLGGEDHNFLFTTEVHTEFTYAGGELFTFTGDDDLWVFINGTLAIDLGGLHGALSETLDMDAKAGILGITQGQTYPMDIFHAERHTSESNFRIETTIDFSCIVNIPPLD